MPLPETGPLSMGQVRTELDLTGAISLGQVDVRDLAGIGSGAVSLQNLRGKSAMPSDAVGGFEDGTLEGWTGGNNYINLENSSTFARSGSWLLYIGHDTVGMGAGRSTSGATISKTWTAEELSGAVQCDIGVYMKSGFPWTNIDGYSYTLEDDSINYIEAIVSYENGSGVVNLDVREMKNGSYVLMGGTIAIDPNYDLTVSFTGRTTLTSYSFSASQRKARGTYFDDYSVVFS